MQYVLDPRILPPGGAAVQCTRCGHVFMASPQAPTPPPRPAPAATGQGGAPSGITSTQLYGTGRPPVPSTQIFGSGPHPKPTMDGALPTPVPNTTQAFGALPPSREADRSVSAVPATPSGASVEVTLEFGTVPPQGTTAPGNTTQAFGAVPAQGTTSPGNTTQAFGAVQGGAPRATPGKASGAVPAQAPTSPGNATQAFGAVPAQPSMSPGNATQAFGAVPAQGSSAPGNATQAFGAVPAQPSMSPGNATQAFGAAPAQPSMSPGNATQAFGAVPAQPSMSPGNATQAFGAVPAQSSASPGNATRVFGAVPAQSSASPSNATRVFGAVPAQGSSAPGNARQAFGAVVPRGPAPQGLAQSVGAVPSHDAPVPSHPQASGAVPAHARPAQLGRSQPFGAIPAPVGSARVIGVPPVAPAQEPGTPSRSSSGIFPARTSTSAHGATQALGAVPATPPPDSQRPVGTTQSYGAVSAEPPPGSSTSGPGIGRTAVFGATPVAPVQDAGIRLPPESPATVGSKTLLPFGPTSQGSKAVEPVSGTPSALRRPPVELPPELLAVSRAPSSREGGDSGRPVGREQLLLPLVAVAGLVLTTVLAYPAWRDRNSDMPPAAVEDKDRAAALLRRDDLASREEAIQRLRTLNAAHPKYTEAQAELAVALALRVSDLQAEFEQLRNRADILNREKDATLDIGDAQEQRRQVASLDQQLAELTGQMGSLRSEVNALHKELDQQIAVLSPAPDVEPAPALVARLKARAIQAGVTGAPDALALAERLRNAEGTPSTWSTLARAEYALSSGSPPDSLMGVAKELAQLRQEDRTLLRAYVLGARLSLRLNEAAMARSLLDDVLALNPNHQLASRLLAQLHASDSP